MCNAMCLKKGGDIAIFSTPISLEGFNVMLKLGFDHMFKLDKFGEDL